MAYIHQPGVYISHAKWGGDGNRGEYGDHPRPRFLFNHVCPHPIRQTHTSFSEVDYLRGKPIRKGQGRGVTASAAVQPLSRVDRFQLKALATVPFEVTGSIEATAVP